MVKGQPTSRQEIENLLGIVERDRSQAYLGLGVRPSFLNSGDKYLISVP